MVAFAPNLNNDLSIATTTGSSAIPGIPATGTTPSSSVVLTAADLTGPGPDPTSAMAKFTAQNNVSTLHYPGDLPMAYFTMLISKYSRQNWQSIGELSTITSVTLPLPMQMVDHQETSYDIESLNFVGAAAIGGVNQAFNNFVPGSSPLSALAKGIGTAATNVDGSTAVGGAIGQAASAAGGAGVLSAAGAAVNQFMTVMLKGPVYKNWTFQWKFSPRNAAESQALYDIKNILNNASASSIYPNFGSAFFRWPCIFSPSFNYASTTGPVAAGNLGMKTFLMKKSVVRDIQWNYTPAGKPSFYAGTGGSPESIELTMTFLALEFFLSDTSGGGTTGDYGAGPGDGGVSVSGTNNQIPWSQLVSGLLPSNVGGTVFPVDPSTGQVPITQPGGGAILP